MAPFILACSAFLALSGCDGTTGISSDSGFTGVATAPVAVDDTAAGVTATATTISVVANDTDVDNDLDVSSVQIVGNPIVPGEGNWTVDATGSVTFTPEAGFTGDPVTISYTVSDDTDLVSNEATVTIDYPQTYFENNTTYHIPDAINTGTPGEVVISEINATNAVTVINEVTVTVDITHTSDADLIIRLIGPLGDSIILSSDNGVDGDNYTNTTFDDGADFSITDTTNALAPFTGTFMPEESLGIFVNDNATGIWTLEVSDDGELDVGTLNSWSITIE